MNRTLRNLAFFAFGVVLAAAASMSSAEVIQPPHTEMTIVYGASSSDYTPAKRDASSPR